MTRSEITIQSGSTELLDRIAPLWAELRIHHADLSPQWREVFLACRFADRKAELIKKSPGGLLVLLAMDGDATVAYCVCSIDAAGRGEVDSLFVTESHRRRGIARRLMTDSVEWLTAKDAKPIVVSILAGNDEALKLYESFGFLPRTLTYVRPG